MARRKWDPRQFVLNTLKRKSYMLPAISAALDKARRGFGLYECVECRQVVARKNLEKDHEPPVIPITGWDDYNGVIERWLGERSEIRVMCKPCHKAKSKRENAARRQSRKRAK